MADYIAKHLDFIEEQILLTNNRLEEQISATRCLNISLHDLRRDHKAVDARLQDCESEFQKGQDQLVDIMKSNHRQFLAFKANNPCCDKIAALEAEVRKIKKAVTAEKARCNATSMPDETSKRSNPERGSGLLVEADNSPKDHAGVIPTRELSDLTDKIEHYSNLSTPTDDLTEEIGDKQHHSKLLTPTDIDHPEKSKRSDPNIGTSFLVVAGDLPQDRASVTPTSFRLSPPGEFINLSDGPGSPDKEAIPPKNLIHNLLNLSAHMTRLLDIVTFPIGIPNDLLILADDFLKLADDLGISLEGLDSHLDSTNEENVDLSRNLFQENIKSSSPQNASTPAASGSTIQHMSVMMSSIRRSIAYAASIIGMLLIGSFFGIDHLLREMAADRAPLFGRLFQILNSSIHKISHNPTGRSAARNEDNNLAARFSCDFSQKVWKYWQRSTLWHARILFWWLCIMLSVLILGLNWIHDPMYAYGAQKNSRSTIGNSRRRF